MRKTKGIIASIGAVLLLAGCATTTNIWSKSGVSKTQAAADLKACASVAGLYYDPTGYQGGPVATSSTGTYERSSFDKCMQGKGYSK